MTVCLEKISPSGVIALGEGIVECEGDEEYGGKVGRRKGNEREIEEDWRDLKIGSSGLG
jgi:hypothetical protein